MWGWRTAPSVDVGANPPPRRVAEPRVSIMCDWRGAGSSKVSKPEKQQQAIAPTREKRSFVEAGRG